MRRVIGETTASAETHRLSFETEYELLEGDPAREIAGIAEARDADLVVVGTRGLGAVAGSLLFHPQFR